MYQALRSRGHEHARSLRSVADRLLNIACAPASTSTRTVPGLARRRPPLGSWPCGPSGAGVERLAGGFSGCSADTSGTARADTITFRLSRDAATGQ